MVELTFTAMQHLPHEYLTSAEAAGWARVSPEAIRQAVETGDLRSTAGSLIRVRDLDRWSSGRRAIDRNRRTPQLADHRVDLFADAQ